MQAIYRCLHVPIRSENSQPLTVSVIWIGLVNRTCHEKPSFFVLVIIDNLSPSVISFMKFDLGRRLNDC